MTRKRLPEVGEPIDFRLSLADLGNAQRLVHYFGARLRWVKPLNRWFYFDGQRWAVDETGEVMRCAKATALAIAKEADAWPSDEEALWKWAKTSKGRSRLEAMIVLAGTEPSIALIPDQLDADPWLLNVLNGTVDLRTGELRAHDAADLQTKICYADYSPGATSDRWERFLDDICERNDALKGFLKRAVGCSLSGDENEKALFVLWGEGDTGKTTFIRAVMEVLGDYAVQAERNLLLQRKHEAHPTGIADLFGRRLAVCTEVNKDQRFDEGLVKQLTGGDRLKARWMRQDFFEFDPTHTLWLACNDVPHVDPSGGAMWNRLFIIPFTNAIPVEQQDKHLVDGLLEDAEAILAWAVEGCMEWQQEGLGEPPELARAKAQQRKLVDPVYRFIDEGCDLTDGPSIEATILYEVFKKWASRRGLPVLTQKVFGSRLSAMGLSKGRGSNGRTLYKGVGLLKDLNHSPLSAQQSEVGVITEDPSEGSEEELEVAGAVH